ncbi:aldehyde dehydrogenase family protein [Propionibacteriaceae bacterium Y2011]
MTDTHTTQCPTGPGRAARTGEQLTAYPQPTPAQVADTVRTAREAADWWAGLTAAQRKRRLLAYKHELVAARDELATMISTEAGKPMADAMVEVMISMVHLDWAARHAGRVMRRRTVYPGLLGLNTYATVEREPYGVVAVLGPWNYPLFTPGGSIWYALAAGNAVVFKPSEYTPGVAELLARLWLRANPERPVLQFLSGDGRAGAELIRSGVDKVAFTGSTATAKKVMAQAAESLTPVVLECGGKDAALVAADADLAAVAKSVAFGAFSNAGQTCAGVKRVYVVDEAADDFLGELDRELDGIRADADVAAPYGPMVLPQGPDVVADHLADAISHGAQVRHGGEHAFHRPFVDPIVVVDAPEDSAAVSEETFGPLLVVNRVPDLPEAVQRTNANALGLTASIWTADVAAAKQLATRLRVSTVTINTAIGFMGTPTLPFGGRGASGFGRIHGDDGIREFSVAKSRSRLLFDLPIDVMTLRHPEGNVDRVSALVQLLHGRR